MIISQLTGAATALELARHGLNIVAAVVDQNGLDKLVRQIVGVATPSTLS
ncbi:hypothetical protein [Pantoea agglomerans]|nr:hypothetical protein [Pantoea agglomerans]WNK41802.1 hypothetical protein RM160_20380 [Pantoea agglomerans]